MYPLYFPITSYISGLKDILAYPSSPVLHNFSIASSNISDNLQTNWSDKYNMDHTKCDTYNI